ncbi:hypothetical protein PIB30_079130 [Stylosanthes scabra]|uniref:Uncharacterized protein n=1 Tax=Stylosanthes scabra TaxID=79078 RepID=A0ABU6XRH6_9FABA|nr:hypothetical protein [Stylosanthes scabra]
MRLAGRKEIPPRYLDPNLLVTQNFDHLREILEYQGIMNFVQIRDKYYPNLVAIAYSTLMIEVNEENESDFSLVFKLGKDEYKLGCSELAIIWGLANQGCLFEGGKTPIGDWGYSKENAMGIFNLTQGTHTKIPCNPMKAEYRTLLYIISYILQLRVSGHATVCDEDLIIMWAMVNNIKINWPYFIVQHMIRLKKKKTSGGLGYLCLWTRIFNRVGIDLTNEKVKHVPSQSFIDIRLLHKMGRGAIEEGQEDQETQETPPQAQEQVGPSMRDLMQVLQRIERKQDRLDRRLHRIEQYMEIEEDEDEDQD